jgi:hypothetical protein
VIAIPKAPLLGLTTRSSPAILARDNAVVGPGLKVDAAQPARPASSHAARKRSSLAILAIPSVEAQAASLAHPA